MMEMEVRRRVRAIRAPCLSSMLSLLRKWYTFDPVGEDNKDQNCFEYLRRLAWSGISGVDSLGDAQTIIQATPLPLGGLGPYHILPDDMS